MSYPELNRRAALAGLVEGTAGTAETVTFTDNAIRTIGVSEPEGAYLSPNDRDEHMTGGLGIYAGAVPGGRHWRFRVQFAPVGAGAAYAYTSEASNTLPECHPILRVAGMSLTVDDTASSESASYAQNDDPVTTATFKLRVGGKEYTIKGAVCESFSMNVSAAGFPVIDATIVGVHEGLTETALGTVTYDSVSNPIWKGSNSLLVGAYAPQGRTLTVDHGLAAEPNVSNNAADGLLFFKIVRRRPVITVSARVPAIATWDPHAALAARTATTLDAAFGSTQYAKFSLNVDNATYIDVQQTADGEMRNYTAQILCGVHASNELTYLFD